MNKETLKQIVTDQRRDFLMKKSGAIREKIAEAETYLKLPHIYVISGIRRCGKSTFLRQIAEHFYNNKDFFFINFEDERLYNFNAAEFNSILEVQIELFGNIKTFIIDEIQNVDKFELFLRRLSDSGYKFIVSGSNAELLSGEISSKITGRHIETTLRPFSFNEFLLFKKFEVRENDLYDSEKRAHISAQFEKYMIDGGMPEYLKYKTSEIITRMYDDIIIKDIVVRNGITNIVPLRELSRYLVSNFGRKFSYNSLQRAIGLGSVNTAKSYCQYLENSFLINNITKFDYSLKKQMANEKKPYLADHSIIRFVSSQLHNDRGRILENMVGSHLADSNEIYYFSDKKECDFVSINRKKNISLFQVTLVLNEENYKREITGLAEAMDYFDLRKGTIITSSQEDEIIESGKKIKVVPGWRFMLNKKSEL
ncbi:MAG: ATP-binding protein [Bacteroidota bacterium]